MLDRLAIELISLYQRYISPYKGYCCAYRVYTGETSCSQYAKSAIGEYGSFRAIPLIRERFKKCSFAASQLNKKNTKKSNNEIPNDCAFQIGYDSIDCLSTLSPKGCGNKSSHSISNNCDIVGDCNPFH